MSEKREIRWARQPGGYRVTVIDDVEQHERDLAYIMSMQNSQYGYSPLQLWAGLNVCPTCGRSHYQNSALGSLLG